MRVTMKYIIPAGIATRESPLGVILSQYYISHTVFCPDFNNKTDIWSSGIPLPTKVTKALRAKEYQLYISSPSVSFLIDMASSSRRINFILLYDIIRFHVYHRHLPKRAVARLFFSTLRTNKIIKITF